MTTLIKYNNLKKTQYNLPKSFFFENQSVNQNQFYPYNRNNKITTCTTRIKETMNNSFIKSPLNFTGGKYKLLKQIFPLFPDDIKTFYDLFAGGCNICINAKANKIIANDNNKKIIELYKYFQNNDINKIINDIENIINNFELSNTYKYGYEFYNSNSAIGISKYNKEKYHKLREAYNNNHNPAYFFTLIIYSFNHQIRFNKDGKYNLPVGKRDFNKNIRKNLILFVEKIHNLHIEFFDKDYREVEIDKEGFVYLDPPYLASTATYNENGGWNEQKEIELLEYIDNLNSNNVKFALSNVFQNKDKINKILIDWTKNRTYNIHFVNSSYSNSNYQAKFKNKKTIEVLITNY